MPRKAGLLKGLGALIPPTEEGQAEEILSPTMLALDAIQPNPRQPRASEALLDGPGKLGLEDLAASIREHGILQPLVVTPSGEKDRYLLIAGERRWRAARLAGLETVPVVVRQASDQQRLELALVENIQRADLSPLETAEAYQMLADDFNLSQVEIARQVGKARPTVANTLRLLKLPGEARQALRDGRISEGHARTLLSLARPSDQLVLLDAILKEALSVRQAEERAQRMNGERPPEKPKLKPRPAPEIEAVQNRLQERLNTRVTLQHGKKGGTLTIYYYSDEELNAILEVIGE